MKRRKPERMRTRNECDLECARFVAEVRPAAVSIATALVKFVVNRLSILTQRRVWDETIKKNMTENADRDAFDEVAETCA